MNALLAIKMYPFKRVITHYESFAHNDIIGNIFCSFDNNEKIIEHDLQRFLFHRNVEIKIKVLLFLAMNNLSYRTNFVTIIK